MAEIPAETAPKWVKDPFEMRSKHWIFVGIGALALILAVFAIKHIPEADASSGDGNTATPRAAFTVARKLSISNQYTVAGEFLPYQEVELHAKVAGYIRKISVDIGDRVKAGQVLAELEVPELAAQVQGSEASVRHNQEEITRAEHELARAEAEHKSLHSGAMRLQQASTARPGLIAQQELDDAEARDRASEAQIEAAKSALSASKQQLDVSKADHQHFAALSDYAHITAPFSGVVTWRYADTGALVQSGTSSSSSQPVVKLAQVDVLRLRIPVPESVARYIKIGTTSDIHLQANDKHLTGTVTRLADAFDPTTRTMQVEIDLPNKDGLLTPGMYADVTLQTQSKQDAIAVPVESVITDGANSKVMVITKDDRIAERVVKTGIQSANSVEIVAGVQEGDRIVVGNPRTYQDGQSVVPVKSALAMQPTQGGA